VKRRKVWLQNVVVAAAVVGVLGAVVEVAAEGAVSGHLVVGEGLGHLVVGVGQGVDQGAGVVGVARHGASTRMPVVAEGACRELCCQE